MHRQKQKENKNKPKSSLKKKKIIEKETPTIAACLRLLLIKPNEEFIERVINKETFIEDDQLVVDHYTIDKSIVPILKIIDSNDI